MFSSAKVIRKPATPSTTRQRPDYFMANRMKGDLPRMLRGAPHQKRVYARLRRAMAAWCAAKPGS
jgi:hypothetical protein